MGFGKMLRANYKKGYIRLRAFGNTYGELLKIWQKREEWMHCKLTDAQMKEVKSYLKQHYGKSMPLWWHRMCTNYTGRFDVKYFPEILFSTRLEEILNPYEIAYPLGNKSFNPQKLFADIDESLKARVPQMYLEDCNGIKWDGNGNVISDQTAIEILNGKGELIIKPTMDTMGAKGVRLIDIRDGKDILSGEELTEILKKYRTNYIVQERVRNHKSIEKLYPHSINTFRIITFISSDGVHLGPLSMRLGMGGEIFDNGGIYIGLDKEGNLRDTGFSKLGIIRYTEHPDTHIKFEGYQVEGVKQMTNAAVSLHSRLPQLRMLSWDFAYDNDGNAVIIEVNTTGQSVRFPQAINGQSIFGDYTEEMYSLIK